MPHYLITRVDNGQELATIEADTMQAAVDAYLPRIGTSYAWRFSDEHDDSYGLFHPLEYVGPDPQSGKDVHRSHALGEFEVWKVENTP